jgi:hypothetical protein
MIIVELMELMIDFPILVLPRVTQNVYGMQLVARKRCHALCVGNLCVTQAEIFVSIVGFLKHLARIYVFLREIRYHDGNN